MRLVTDDMLTEINVPAATMDGIVSMEGSDPLATSSLRTYLRLTQGSDLLIASGWSPDVIVWNRYYWFRRFVKLQSLSVGYDAGLEQQAFQILEAPHPVCTVDWSLLETIEAAVEQDLPARSPD